MQYHHHKKEELAQKAGEAVNEKLRLYPSSPKLILLSGGSSFSILSHIDSSLIGPSCTIAMSDDRYSSDAKINNFLQLKETNFFEKAKARGANLIDTSIQDDETILELAERFETSIKDWKKNGGAIIATMGMGPDGHTCGMMPFPENPEKFEELFENRNLVTGYDAEDKNEYPLRVTVTMTLALQINHAVVYIQGESKVNALDRVAAPDGELANTPARIWLDMNDVDIFSDIELL